MIRRKSTATRIRAPQIVQHSSRRTLVLFVTMLVALAVWGWQTYDFGRVQAGYDVDRAEQRERRLELRVETLEKERTGLRKRLLQLDRLVEIDRDAARGARERIQALQSERLSLQREVAFLRSLLRDQDDPLKARGVHIEPGEGDGQYRYAFTLYQLRRDIGETRGKVDLVVLGHLADEEKSLSLQDMGGPRTLKMGFTHFQRFEGQLRLPEGLEPRTLTLKLEPVGKKLKKSDASYAWEELLASKETP